MRVRKIATIMRANVRFSFIYKVVSIFNELAVE